MKFYRYFFVSLFLVFFLSACNANVSVDETLQGNSREDLENPDRVKIEKKDMKLGEDIDLSEDAVIDPNMPVDETDSSTIEPVNEATSSEEKVVFDVTKNYLASIETTAGRIAVELYSSEAPATVENFIKYANDGFYTGTVFHRVMKDFMIQGGGFNEKGQQKKPTYAPIQNEAANGLKNVRGSIAMARTDEVNSATSQFFINQADNSFLDFTSKDQKGYGYCVFGKVVSGMDVVDKIAGAKVNSNGIENSVPLKPVVINSVSVKIHE